MKYMVKPGDTMYKLAREFGVPFEELVVANPQIEDPDLIMPGQLLNIPIDGIPDVPECPPEPVCPPYTMPDMGGGEMMPNMGGTMPGMGGMMPKCPVCIKKGDRGEHVRCIQKRLKELGLYKGSINGRFGSKTSETVKKLQKVCGMKQTGIVDEWVLSTMGLY